MIQRIQTIYLLIVSILIGIFFFLPFTSFVLEGDMSVCRLSIFGLISDAPSAKILFKAIPLFILVLVISASNIATIFMYKRRMLQIRFCIANIVLLLGMGGLMYYFVSVAKNQLGSHPSYSLIFVFPIISAIFIYMAIRRIAKDEALVRSMDRLR